MNFLAAKLFLLNPSPHKGILWREDIGVFFSDFNMWTKVKFVILENIFLHASQVPILTFLCT